MFCLGVINEFKYSYDDIDVDVVYQYYEYFIQVLYGQGVGWFFFFVVICLVDVYFCLLFVVQLFDDLFVLQVQNFLGDFVFVWGFYICIENKVKNFLYFNIK